MSEPPAPCTRRIVDAFEGRRPDRVAIFNQSVHPAIVSDVLGRAAWTAGGESRWASLQAAMEGPDARRQFIRDYAANIVEFALAVGEDMVRSSWWISPPPNATRVGPNEVRWGSRTADGRQFGRLVFEPDSGSVNEFEDWLAEPDGVERLVGWLSGQDAHYAGPAPHAEADFFELGQLRDRSAGRLALAAGTGGLGVLMYQPTWLEAFVREPELVGRHVQRQADQAIADLPLVARLGVKVLNAGMDLCYNNGPAYSPRLFERYILPPLKRLTQAAHELGLFYVYRTDGNTWPIGQMLFVESGVDGAGEIDYQAGMRLAEMRDAYPNLTLVGNVDCGKVLADGTEEDVRRATRDCLRATGGRRHVMSASNMVIRGTPTKNYLAMVEETLNFSPQ